MFAAIGAAAERLASVWPAEEASRRPIGWRFLALGAVSAASAAAIVWRSTLPMWATAVHLLLLALMVVLVATDLEQRRLPHLALDPLIVAAVGFAVVNPAVAPLDAAIGAVAAVGFLGVLALLVRGGLAAGDLYLAAPIGLVLGWPLVFSGLFTAGLLAGGASLVLLLTRRAQLRTYIPFGPFLVAGYVLTLVREPTVLSVAQQVAAAFFGR